MSICKAHEGLRNEAYTVRRSDEAIRHATKQGGLPRFARNKRRRWAFMDGLLAFGEQAGEALAL
jgi:hypothetical protein